MRSAPLQPWAEVATGVRIAVRLTPRATRDDVEGVGQGPDGRAELRIRVAAAPVDGEANTALIAFLAKALGVAKRAICIRSGASARLKIVEMSGDPAELSARIAGWVGGR